MESPKSLTLSTKREKQLSMIFMEEVYNIPNGEKIRECIQCGTCSASCPTAYAMDHSPRQIIAALRAGQLEKVLESNTLWFCTSCYYCTVRCPSQIPFTEIMYTLKNMAIDFDLAPKKAGSKVLYSTFVNLVNKTGRLHEMGLMVRVLMKVKFRKLIGMAFLGMSMFFKGRLSLFSEKIKRVDQIQMILKDVCIGDSCKEV
ncbi:MAG: 4Fe-4S dicluster domain-containing protein [Candidatus Ranarchaeia archaeon]